MGDNTEASVPHFAWFRPENIFPATNIGSNSFQSTHMHPNPGIAAVPIRSVAPTSESAKNSKLETKPTKVKKKRPSVKNSNQSKKKSSASRKTKVQAHPGAKIERKNPDIVFDKANFDFSGVPPPFCSCTGVSRGCYKGGGGGWQSSCCNTSMSEYPLPMSPSKPGARVSGRKMTSGAYRNLLCRLAAEGHDLSQPVDLKKHWAKHGTNKFVSIK